MIRPLPRGRSGITLTEILISILIMGIGLVSLATLFPLGLLRFRNAARDNRTTLAGESAISEVAARDLFARRTFVQSWYPLNPFNNARFNNYDPWSQDLPPNVTAPAQGAVYRGYGGYNPAMYNQPGFPVLDYIPGPGLPVAYDPLFWAMAHYNTAGTPTPLTPTLSPGTNNNEGRFGSGIGFLRDDPTDKNNPVPSAHGLQRLSNFLPASSFPAAELIYHDRAGLTMRDVASDVFTSLDDIVFQAGTQAASPLVPDISGGQIFNDLSYSWMFTGQQTTAGEYTTFDGSIVMFHNRAFGMDLINGTFIPTGERVVEAAWGWSTSVDATGPPMSGTGYGVAADRVVLIRWPATAPDPNITLGSWIADVTYERSAASSQTRFDNVGPYSGQRCHWYRVVRRGDVQPDPGFLGDPSNTNFRRMVLTLSNPVQSRTLLNNNSATGPVGSPIHVNAALISPFVVNVFPALFRVH
jgi:type II secretory pathway pseudopilin PulG